MSQAATDNPVALAAAEFAADCKAHDIVVVRPGEASSVADYFVIASGRSHIQVEAICARIEEGLKARFDVAPLSVEGLENAKWALMDYGDLVVHVFQSETREVYDLERLWRQLPRWNYEEGSVNESVPA